MLVAFWGTVALLTFTELAPVMGAPTIWGGVAGRWVGALMITIVLLFAVGWVIGFFAWLVERFKR